MFLICYGTRPELIKLFPVYNEFKNKNNFKLSVCFTGQHEELKIRKKI